MALSNAAQAELNGERIYCDSQVVHNGFTLKQLQDAFGQALQPGQAWKDAIRTISTESDLPLVLAAIEFHVGGPSTVTPREFNRGGSLVTLLVVENAGYYANIGA